MKTTITRRQPVTLTPEEATTVSALLRDLSRESWAQARKTKSTAVREYCETRGNAARDLECLIIRRLYETTETT